MYPSCSNFGLDAFSEYNPFKAMAKTSDRLLRCSHDIDYYDIVFIDNKFKLKNTRNLDRKSLNLLRKREISSIIN